MNNKIQTPSVNELVRAIKNTCSKKAMADGNMLQSLFCHKNIFKLIEETEDYQKLFGNRKLSSLDRVNKEEYIKEAK